VDELNTFEEFLLVDRFPTDIQVLQPPPSTVSTISALSDDELVAAAMSGAL